MLTIMQYQNPLISVIFSVKDGEDYLQDAIESILNQQFTDFEFIIVNDGSTDGTGKIIDRYASQDSRIRVFVNEKNIGLTKSLNFAARKARGKYFARMDADDIALPLRFEKQVEFLNSNPDVVLVGSGYKEINSSGEEVGSRSFPEDDDSLRRVLIKHNPFFHSSILMRGNVFNSCNGYDEGFRQAQDYDLWFRFLNHGKIANLSEPHMKRRYSDNIISVRSEKKQVKNALKARYRALRRGQYSLNHSKYLIRPALVWLFPSFVKKFIRKRFLKSNLYG